MPDWKFPSWSKRWNVARLTSEISSSSRVGIRNGAASCQSISTAEPAVGATTAAGISAGDPPVDATQDTPAIPSTDIALFGRFPFAGRFACGIAEFLLYLPSNKRTTSLFYSYTISCALSLHHVRHCISERLSAIAARHFRHLASHCLLSLIKSQAIDHLAKCGSLPRGSSSEFRQVKPHEKNRWKRSQKLTARFRRLDGGASNSLQCDKVRALYSNNSDRKVRANKVRYSTVRIATENVMAFPLSGACKPSAASAEQLVTS